jgi:hypothetical protein
VPATVPAVPPLPLVAPPVPSSLGSKKLMSSDPEQATTSVKAPSQKKFLPLFLYARDDTGM